MNKKPTIAELRALHERAWLSFEADDLALLENAITELESLRGETPRVADGAQQIVRARTDGSLMELIRQPGMTQLPESGDYALGIQPYPDDPTLVEMTLYHEQTGVIAWRTAWNVKKTKSIARMLQDAINQVITTQP